MDGRCVIGCNDIYSTYAHGSKGLAIVAKSGDCGAPSSTFKGQNTQRSNLLWTSKIAPDQHDEPYQNEWNDLMEAIRNDKPYNEAKRGVEASLVSNMGRMAAHTGQEITYDEMLNCEHEFAPDVDKLAMNSPSPLLGWSGRQVPGARCPASPSSGSTERLTVDGHRPARHGHRIKAIGVRQHRRFASQRKWPAPTRSSS